MSDVIAILCSDLHLSDRPPIARAVEPDWFAAMKRSLDELKRIQKECDMCPIFVAGDIFDKWNSSAALINFAIENMPTVYAVPGQHDLPDHNYKEIKRSAYWSLVLADRVRDIRPNEEFKVRDIRVQGFPWGFPVKFKSMKSKSGNFTYLAVVHAYCWSGNKKHPEADESGNWFKWQKKLKGFDVAVFGDNHKGFAEVDGSRPYIVNSGSFMRRTILEREYTPRVYFMYGDGAVESQYLESCGEDQFTDEVSLLNAAEKGLDLAEFMGDLSSLGNGVIDFIQALKQAMDVTGVSNRVRKMVNQAVISSNRGHQ